MRPLSADELSQLHIALDARIEGLDRAAGKHPDVVPPPSVRDLNLIFSRVVLFVGHPADPSQTTYEYASSLGTAFPEASDPVKALADVRVRERYAPGGIDEDAQEAAVTAWHRTAGPLLGLLPGRIFGFVTHLFR